MINFPNGHTGMEGIVRTSRQNIWEFFCKLCTTKSLHTVFNEPSNGSSISRPP